jgi:hypothetical protein
MFKSLRLFKQPFGATPDAVNIFDPMRTHLHNTFRKTGTNRQSELVKPIAGID